MRRFLARLVLACSRYKVTGQPPTAPVCVMVAAPHTSNWDFILMIAMAWRSGISPVWLGKKEMFWGPMAPLFRAMGGIPVNRQNPAGLADKVAGLAREGRVSAVVIPPEATRSLGTVWKSGFRRIAIDAGIPIVLTYLDGPTRTGGFGPTFMPTDDVVADMDVVREFYADKHGLKPHLFTPPLLREEQAVAAETPDA
jgi:1-acyl-sn-glycerol-3-phosphate acyltransferase